MRLTTIIIRRVQTAEQSLADLAVGYEGTVVDVRCDRPIARRLMEMGMLPGTRVRVVRVAPFGDPIELRLRSYALSIRKREAAGVLLRDVTEPASRPLVAVVAPGE